MSLAARVAKLRQLCANGSPRLRRILDLRQFTRADVIEVTGASEHQLHNWVSRGWIELSGEQHPGKGRRRLFTGRDSISVALGLQLQPFGMMQVANRLSNSRHMSSRAIGMLTDRSFEWGRAVAIVPSSEAGKWVDVPFGPGTRRGTHDFSAAVILDVDRLILETLERLVQVIEGDPLSSTVQKRPTVADDPIRMPRWSDDFLSGDEGDEYLVSTSSHNF